MSAHLTLPDGSRLESTACMVAIETYVEYGPAILDFYDGTIHGPHDKLTPEDIMSLIALDPWPRQSNKFNVMTMIWQARKSIEKHVPALPRLQIQEVPIEHQNQLAEQCHLALLGARYTEHGDRIHSSVFDVIPSKLLHRLRPGLIPIWDNRVADSWYYEHKKDPDWTRWLKRVWAEVSEPETLACLQHLQDQPLLTEYSPIRLSILRIWDIILWKLAVL